MCVCVVCVCGEIVCILGWIELVVKFTSISQVGEEELSVVCGTSYSPVSGEVQTCALYGV